MLNNISQRDAFWGKIYEIACDNKDIIAITADMGAPALDKFRSNIPGQFINAGISEQNAITVAAGLSLEGKKVFTYAIAPFITLRCLEQIRVESAIMKIPINFVGVGTGFGYEDSGPTHHLIEDISIMRAMPNIVINSISDSIMASAFAEILCNSNTSHYIRLERKILPDIYAPGTDFSDGVHVLKPSPDFYLLSTGSMVHTALEIANNLKKRGVNIGVIDIFTLPININHFLKKIDGIKKLISLEEHFLPGGLGSAICEILIDNNISIPLKRLGLAHEKSYCYKYGGREFIMDYYDLDKTTIEDKIIKFLPG